MFSDAALLVVDKPIGWLTHADGDGRRPDVVTALGGGLGVHHRLDVDTSGVLAFSRGPEGARRLARALEHGQVEKVYLAVLQGRLPSTEGVARGAVPEAPDRGAETAWRVCATGPGWTLVEARPRTGRTHQIRAHFAQLGCPVLGDLRYGDPLEVRAPRLMLHALRLVLTSPEEGGLTFEAPPPPEFARFTPAGAAGRVGLRAGLRQSGQTTAFRELHEAADGLPGLRVDRYADWLWVQRDVDLGGEADDLVRGYAAQGVYRIDAERDRSRGAQTPPRLVAGAAAPPGLEVLEAGVRYRVELGAHLSTGLFLDQRERRAHLARASANLSVLNTFAHAGGFTVAAAVGGAARTVSIDLDRVWLSRIAPQLEANGLDPDPKRHDTIYGDVFDWLKRLSKRGETFDLVILDPPSTSVGREGRRFSAARDYDTLAALAAPLVARGGRLWTITNHRGSTSHGFAQLAARGLGPDFSLERAWPMPVDHPEDGPPSVKTLVWARD